MRLGADSVLAWPGCFQGLQDVDSDVQQACPLALFLGLIYLLFRELSSLHFLGLT